MQGKVYTDEKRHATKRVIEPGDRVLVRQEKTNKLASNFCPEPCEVISREGKEVVVRNESGAEMRRNMSYVKKYWEPSIPVRNTDGLAVEENTTSPLRRPAPVSPVRVPVMMPAPVKSRIPTTGQETPGRTRPTREIRMPKRFEDYDVSDG